VLGEKLDWSNDPSVKEVMSRFKRETVWPHIAKQEREEMHFLFYLDYLRVFPYSFYVKDPSASASASASAGASASVSDSVSAVDADNDRNMGDANTTTASSDEQDGDQEE
jgi:hypothetical protein